MSAVTAPPAGTDLRRMSVWTASWSLFGGGIVGSIAGGVLESGLSWALRIDDPGGRYSAVWRPFVPTSDWERAADLATLAVFLLLCALCARRISRDGTLELPLAAAAAGIAAVGLVGYATHSWWSLLAIVPAAFIVSHAARPPSVLSRRTVLVAGVCAIAYLAVVGAAFADLQSHPLAASPNMSCGGGGGPGILQPVNPQPGAPGPLEYRHRPGTTVSLCLAVRNNAWSDTATVLGVASSALPKPRPWTITASAVSIPASQQDQVLVAVHMTRCPAVLDGRSAVLRSIPLRARVDGAITTEPIALTRPIATRCPPG
jgi:hypothetical protein